jgi:tetratricopeptide (TPR) repeat protein
LAGNAWLVVDLLESGDRDAVEAQVKAFEDGARQLRQPLYLWNAAVWEAMLALLDGRLEEAESLAVHALAAGARAESVTASQYYGVQLLAIRQEQGRMGELEQPAREFVKAYPTVPAWRAGLARLLLEVGETENARRELDVLAAYEFEDIPRDGNWMVAMTLLGELCAGLGDSERAARLYGLLLPFRDVNVVIGLGALCQGSAARYLGLLAACTGSQEEARELFEQALQANAALRAPVCLAHTQLDYADALGPSTRAAELVDAAARTAEELGLTAVAQRAAKLRTASRVCPEA